ncbi:unnamed protein product [Ceutorhynchus assimilis]|uniref:Beta-galactosidase n=1 Tax=Ceutorhynchus assimilis TaxID=467358 RepID=A0A9N9MIQ1_9CUCU|nr:unnamed protein product [Ceutorhynchus assimilis]
MASFDLKVAVSLLPIMDDTENTTQKLIDAIELYDSMLNNEGKPLLIKFVLKTRLSNSAKLRLSTSYNSVNDLLGDIKKHFLTIKSDSALQLKLFRSKQGDKSIESFGKDLEELFVNLTISQAKGDENAYNVLKPINERLALKQFTDGLRNQRLSTIMASRNFSYLKDAIRAAQDEETTFFNSNPQIYTASRRGQGRFMRNSMRGSSQNREGASKELALLKAHQPQKPLMVTEYWTGWFDHFSEKHHDRDVKKFEAVLEDILMWKSSFNLYMMHGGTNWGFYNGGNVYGKKNDNSGFQPDTSSYDYDAPLSENGDYTDKYLALQRLTAKYNDIYIQQPHPPEPSFRIAYPESIICQELSLNNLIQQSPHIINSSRLLPMEELDINNGSGQSYGYIVYRKENIDIKAGAVLKIEGHVSDTLLVLINGVLVSKIFENEHDLDGFGYWRQKNSTLNLGEQSYEGATLDLVVENFGRINFGKLHQFNQYKGLWQGDVLIGNEKISNWKIIPLEFKKRRTESLEINNGTLIDERYQSLCNIGDMDNTVAIKKVLVNEAVEPEVREEQLKKSDANTVCRECCRLNTLYTTLLINHNDFLEKCKCKDQPFQHVKATNVSFTVFDEGLFRTRQENIYKNVAYAAAKFSIDMFKHNDNDISYYTGFPSYDNFKISLNI